MAGAPSWQLQQLYALWQQRQARLSRWAAGTLAFAALVPVLVLGPYERTTRASAELVARLATADDHARQLAAETSELEAVQVRLTAISEDLQQVSWQAHRDELRDQMLELGADWARLEKASPQTLARAARLLEEASRIQSPVQFPNPRSGPNPDQNPDQNPDRKPDRNADQNPNQFPNRAAPPNAANAPARPIGAGSASDEADADEVDSADEVPEIAGALERLKIDATELAGAEAQARHDLLAARVEVAAGNAAAASIAEAAMEMRHTVVEPLQDLIATHPGLSTRVPTLPEAAQRTAAEVDEWERRYANDHEWYRTFAGKGETMLSLRRAMDRGPERMPGRPEAWSEAVRAAIADEQSRAQGRIDALEAQRAESRRQAEAYQSQQAILDAKLKAILPSWLGQLVSPPELMTLYAPAMIVLLGILAASAWRVRQSFLALRGTADVDGLSLETIAAGSTWTLARRDVTATAATGLVYLGGLGLLWALFTYGTGLAASFASTRLAGGPTTPETIVDSLVGAPAQPSLRVLGHAAFALCTIGVVATLTGGRRVA